MPKVLLLTLHEKSVFCSIRFNVVLLLFCYHVLFRFLRFSSSPNSFSLTHRQQRFSAHPRRSRPRDRPVKPVQNVFTGELLTPCNKAVSTMILSLSDDNHHTFIELTMYECTTTRYLHRRLWADGKLCIRYSLYLHMTGFLYVIVWNTDL